MRALDHQPFTDDERLEVKRLDQQLAAATSAKLLIGSAEEAIELPGTIFLLLQQILHQIGEDKMLFVQDKEEMLTTQEAADILHVSRPYLIKLLEQGEISFIRVGKHRRIRASDLLNFKRQLESEQLESVAALARYCQDMGI